MYQIRSQNDDIFFLRLLTEADLKETRILCDECVGENLYPWDVLVKAMEETEQFFYLLTTKEDEIIGYIYYYLTDVKSIADYAKINVELFYTVYQETSKAVGKIQSVGLKEKYRKSGLAAQMIGFVLKELKDQSVEMAVSVCWKMGEIVPLKKALRECGFCYLSDAEKIWYDDVELICPYCKGRCLCDAEVHYRIL